jgi:hypothetical protein
MAVNLGNAARVMSVESTKVGAGVVHRARHDPGDRRTRTAARKGDTS